LLVVPANVLKLGTPRERVVEKHRPAAGQEENVFRAGRRQIIKNVIRNSLHSMCNSAHFE
jgi:hypothetical protein